MRRFLLIPLIVISLNCKNDPTGNGENNPEPVPVSEVKADILTYLKSVASEGKIIAGQQCRDGNAFTAGYQDLVVELEKQTGKTMALVGADFGWDTGTDMNKLALDLKVHWDKGGLITASWHCVNPWNGNGCRDMNIGKMSDLVTPGKPGYFAWRQDLIKMAEALKLLKNAGAVLLWRPLHEMNGNWFWWCNRDQAGYIALWQDMYHFLVDENGLDNLIWIYSPNAVYPGSSLKDVMFYYPGDEYVDLVGEDIYKDNPDTYGHELYSNNVEKQYIIGEFGALQKRGTLSNTIPMTAFRGKAACYLQWHSWSGNPVAIIDNPDAEILMNHEDVITLDELEF